MQLTRISRVKWLWFFQSLHSKHIQWNVDVNAIVTILPQCKGMNCASDCLHAIGEWFLRLKSINSAGVKRFGHLHSWFSAATSIIEGSLALGRLTVATVAAATKPSAFIHDSQWHYGYLDLNACIFIAFPIVIYHHLLLLCCMHFGSGKKSPNTSWQLAWKKKDDTSTNRIEKAINVTWICCLPKACEKRKSIFKRRPFISMECSRVRLDDVRFDSWTNFPSTVWLQNCSNSELKASIAISHCSMGISILLESITHNILNYIKLNLAIALSGWNTRTCKEKPSVALQIVIQTKSHFMHLSLARTHRHSK